jgi:transposase
MDAHARTCVVKVKDESGKLLESDTLASTRSALLRLAEKYPGATVVLEASSVHQWIYETLQAAGMDVHACHPQNIRRVLGKKNDEVDAGFLVDAYRLGVLPESYVPPPEIRDRRQLGRHRAFLARETRAVKNRIHGILKRRGITLTDPDTNEETTDVFLKRNREELLKIPEYELRPLTDMLDFLDKKITSVEKLLAIEATKDEGARLLMTIPGFGEYTAVTLSAEIGEIDRFKNADALAAYFGLVPSESQSGETLVRGHITRRGSALVRGLLNQAAWNHIRLCPQSSISKNYKRLTRKIGAKKSIVATERKLVKAAYWMLKEHREFTINGQASPLAANETTRAA